MSERHGELGRDARPSDARSRDLVFAPDDEADPTEITVFPERAVDATTAWLTMDVDHVVDLDEHA